LNAFDRKDLPQGSNKLIRIKKIKKEKQMKKASVFLLLNFSIFENYKGDINL